VSGRERTGKGPAGWGQVGGFYGGLRVSIVGWQTVGRGGRPHGKPTAEFPGRIPGPSGAKGTKKLTGGGGLSFAGGSLVGDVGGIVADPTKTGLESGWCPEIAEPRRIFAKPRPSFGGPECAGCANKGGGVGGGNWGTRLYGGKQASQLGLVNRSKRKKNGLG